ncbi:hypothetical protein PVL29_013396 [Vitis rotundifolia]|uniref:WPP domain-associated protein n=1 Tax=Vitis rotundifolia TaxID=103349 RepID=A0AA38ZLJ9_VITRO|nr:hypothetical protein PVL29_013396 [Vitis rotundifolia]
MESPEILESVRVSDASVSSCGDGLVQLSNSVKGSENLGDDLLEDLDSYLEDINDRLTISRMVSNSVIKGMVNAVAQEAKEKIAMKDLEVAGLKEALHFCHVDADETDPFTSLINFHEAKNKKCRSASSLLAALAEHDRLRESLGNLKSSAREQFKKLQKEISVIRGSSPMRRINSSSEVVGLCGILQEKASEKWTDVDKTIDTLMTTLDTVYEQANNIVYLSKASVSEWLQDWEFQGEIEAMVIELSIRSLREEFEERLWNQNAHFCGNGSVYWPEKMKEISRLRQELDAISKMLSTSEFGQLISHGSCEIGEEWNNTKGTDHFHRKVLSNHVSPATSVWEGNGKHEESKTSMPENLESSSLLKHMSKEELVNHFKTEMTKMRRNHESQVQEMAEQYISLKGKFLKERGSSLPLRKDKEFDAIRKKIPEVILKLDDILVENEKLPAFSNNAESLGSLKDRLDTLLSENHQLRDSLTDKKKEVRYLSTQLSDAAQKMSQHSLAEAKLLKIIGNLKSAIEDAKIEASISEDVNKCILSEVTNQIKCDTEDSNMESTLMQQIYEVILREAAQNAETTSKYEIEDSDMEFIIMQGLSAIIYREAMKDAEAKLNIMNVKYDCEKEARVSIEIKVVEKEKALRLEFDEKERLKQEIILLEASLEEKERSALEIADAFVKEKEQFKLASQELNNLREHTNQQQKLISESSREADITKGNLVEALEQIDLQKVEICELKQKLEITRKELGETDEQGRMLLAVAQETQNALSLVEAREREHNKQMESIIVFMNGLSKVMAEFEGRVEKDIKRNSFRLEHANSQLTPLIQKANILRRTSLRYKQRLERRYSDLQKAEAEVCLLNHPSNYFLICVVSGNLKPDLH